ADDQAGHHKRQRVAQTPAEAAVQPAAEGDAQQRRNDDGPPDGAERAQTMAQRPVAHLPRPPPPPLLALHLAPEPLPFVLDAPSLVLVGHRPLPPRRASLGARRATGAAP